MTATWTTPKTWSSALVTSTDMNTHIRDNFDYLKARPIAQVRDLDGTVSNTTSTSFVDITGASTTITTSGSSRLLVLANGSWTVSAGPTTAAVTVNLDGVDYGDATRGMLQNVTAGGPSEFWAFHWMTDGAVAAGAHTVKLRYKTSANTLTVSQFSLIVLEVL